jgi:hypothetical protein
VDRYGRISWRECKMESVAGKRRKSRLSLDSEEEERERTEA